MLCWVFVSVVQNAFGIDDDSHHDSAESNAPANSKLTIEFPNLLSVDQLLQSVSLWSNVTSLLSPIVLFLSCAFRLQILETAHHVGRVSVSTAPETSYKDVANHCETLLQGKQQKMTLLTLASRNANAGGGAEKAHGGIPSGVPKVLLSSTSLRYARLKYVPIIWSSILF